MVRKILSSAFLLWGMAAGAQTLDSLWRAMPDDIVPVLTSTNRLDMADFIASGMEARVTNRFGGQSVMDTMVQDYLHITLTAQTVMEVRYIKAQRIVLVAHTAMGRSTQLSAYDTNWNAVSLPFALPQVEDMIEEGADKELIDWAKATGTVTARLQPDSDSIAFTLHFDDMPREERKRLQARVKCAMRNF